MLDILTDDGILNNVCWSTLQVCWRIQMPFSFFKTLEQYMIRLLSSIFSVSCTYCREVRDHLTSQCCQPARCHMVVLKSFSAPPLKGYSPCHLPLVMIKANIVIVSTFGTVSALRCSLRSCHSHLLSTILALHAGNISFKIVKTWLI